jgi:hypothetical protein
VCFSNLGRDRANHIGDRLIPIFIFDFSSGHGLSGPFEGHLMSAGLSLIRGRSVRSHNIFCIFDDHPSDCGKEMHGTEEFDFGS